MIKKLFYQMFLHPIMPRYADEGGGGNGDIPDLPEGFDMASLQGDNWHAQIQAMEELKENPVALNTKSPIDAIKQLVNANSLLGKDRLPTPQEDWGDDDWAKHYSRLGRPDAATDYKFEAPEIEGFEVNEEFTSTVNEGLHALGLNGKQYEGTMGLFFDWLGKAQAADAASKTQQFDSASEALKAELGDKYDAQVALANNLMSEFADPEYFKEIGESGLGNDPRFIKMMMNVAQQFGDDTAVGVSINQNLSATNKAINEIAEMKADQAFGKALMNEEDPGHKLAVKKWQDAHKRAYPQ